MKHKGLLASGLVAFLAILMVTAVSAAGNANLADVRMATAQFHRTEVAEASGYNLLPGLDHCFNNPGVGAMGYHYIDAGSLDLEVDPLHPEAMVYAPGPDGSSCWAR